MNRDKYIIVFHDITQANPDWESLYKAYLPAESLLSAELLAKSVKGMVVGIIDDEGDECYFEDGMETAVREAAQSKFVVNAGVQLRKRKTLGNDSNSLFRKRKK